jgi:hypothetical protein
MKLRCDGPDTYNSGVAQWLACWAHNPKVRGSKPRSARQQHSFCTATPPCYRPAQSAFHRPRTGRARVHQPPPSPPSPRPWAYNEFTRDGTRTRNLLLRREAPYPLGHTSCCSPPICRRHISAYIVHWLPRASPRSPS